MNRFPLTKFQKRTETATWLLAALTAVWTLLRWHSLPELVAIHYNAFGTADDWGGRWMALMAPALMVGCCGIVSFCSRLGLKSVNLPFRVNMEREWYVLRAVRDTLSLLNLELAVTFAVVQWCTLGLQNLPLWFGWMMAGVILTTSAFGLWRAWQCNQGAL